VRYNRATRYVLVLALSTLTSFMAIDPFSSVHAPSLGSYSLAPVFPGYAQEGNTIALVLTVSGANATTYQFRFYVQDPSTKIFHSILENYTNFPNPQFQFSIIVVYPSTTFQGRNSLVGQYLTWADQVMPVAKTNVASSSFYFILTDQITYQRTQSVSIQANGYNASETVTATIRPQSSPTLVFSASLRATSLGVVTTSWKIPRNATVASYIVTLTGTSTVKNPPDIQGIAVIAASMTIPALTSSKSSYQRTETLQFSFEPTYPDDSNATTGTATITLTDPLGTQFNLTAAYNSATKSFTANYKTRVTDSNGTWTATMAANSFDDGYGNIGAATPVTSAPQLTPATLTISSSATTYVGVGQQLKLNATITYPDGSALQSGSVGAYLLYSGTPTVNDTVPIVFDSGLQFWIGSYTLQSTDPGGLWSLFIKASDVSTPPNTGSTTKVVTTQDHSPSASFTPSTTSASAGTSISFNGTASYDPDGTVASWSWNFGDGSSGLGSTATHTYTTANTYTVTLTVTDNSGSTGTGTSQITITGLPPDVSFSPSTTTPASGQTVTISITASDQYGSIVTTKVDWGDGTTDALGSTTSDSHSYTLTGSTSKSYTITVTVTNNSGQTTSATSSVSVQPASSGSSGNLSLPLYYFGILALAIAALLGGGFLAFRRHRVTHARLKIDLEAVKSEAGRIENQDFFQSVKDQLKKDKDEQ
jgi:plastocyanin